MLRWADVLRAYQALRPTQPAALCRTGNEYWLKNDEALWLEVKGTYGSFH